MKKVFLVAMVLTTFMLILSGCQKSDTSTKGTEIKNPAVVSANVQTVTTKFSANSYEPITVQANVPVKWTIQMDEKDLNNCNGEMIINEYGITQKFVPGDNVVEFTPTETGKIPYSCWMGMINSNITVVDQL